MPVPVAARSKAYFFGCSSAEIVASNPTEGMDVCCECYVFSGRGLCDGLITRPEESYRLWRVVCDQETSKTRKLRPLPGCENTTTMACNARKTNKATVYSHCIGTANLVYVPKSQDNSVNAVLHD